MISDKGKELIRKFQESVRCVEYNQQRGVSSQEQDETYTSMQKNKKGLVKYIEDLEKPKTKVKTKNLRGFSKSKFNKTKFDKER